MHEVQVNLAIMQNVVQNPMVAIDSFSKKVAALPLKDRLATTKATAMRTVIDSLGVPSQVYSEDGTEFKKEFKQLPNLWSGGTSGRGRGLRALPCCLGTRNLEAFHNRPNRTDPDI